tara:strand:- start:1240 stop:2319 length:1080 start_codon:yes stop_codon:yes gene_type:complete
MTLPEEHMREALSLAKKGLLTTRPNPLVGCVITHRNKVIGRGWHERAGQNHAEVNAINDVHQRLGESAKSVLKESEMFVTLEPCSTFGKTAPCADAIRKHGIKKVYIASEDTSQDGFAIKEKNITIETGLLRDDAREINKGFFSRIERKRPFITAKMGIGLDGGIALASGESKWITSVQSREDVHKLRAINDAILTGVGTVLDDNPSLTSRDSGYDIDKVIQPLRVVIDRNNKLTGKEEVFSDDAETIVFSNGDYDVNTSVAENIEYKNLINVMRHLAEEKQINNLLVEAGSGIFDALLTENLIDCLILYQSPKILGKNRKTFSKLNQTDKKLSTMGFNIESIEHIGDDKKIIFKPNYS